MNKKPSLKAIARFVLLTTPAIALVLYGIFKTISMTTGISPCYRQPVAKAQPQTALIDQLLFVDKGLKHFGNIVLSESRTVNNGPSNPDIRVDEMLLAFPQTMPMSKIDAELRATARELFEDGATCVKVTGFLVRASMTDESVPKITSELTFAPHGDLTKTDRIYNLSEYKTVIKHELLQQPKHKLLVFIDAEPTPQGAE